MLIHVDASVIADALAKSTSSARSQDCLSILLCAHWEGNHIVSMDPQDVETLCQSRLSMDRRALRALHDVAERYPEIEGLRNDVPWTIEVGIGARFDGRAVDIEKGRRVIRIPPHAFDSSSKFVVTRAMHEAR